MRVFERHQHRAARRESIEPGDERPEEKRLPLLRRHVWQSASRRALNSKQISKERNCIVRQPLAVLVKERFTALEPFFRGVIRCEPRLPLERKTKGKSGLFKCCGEHA